MDDLLEMAKNKVDEAEVYEISTEETPVKFEANRLKILETRETSGLALRVVKDGRVGLASTTSLSDRASLVDMAEELTPFGAEAKFELPGPDRYPKVRVYDPALARLPVARMVEMGQEMIDRVHAYDPAILCSVDIRKMVGTIKLRNSRGGQAEFRQSVFSVGLNGNLVRGTDILDIYESDVSSDSSLDHRAMVDTLVQKFELAKELAPSGTKTMPVIFTPKAASSIILLSLAIAFNGKMVLQGASPLTGKLGEEVFDRQISVFDDGTIDNRPTSRPFDDEGVPVRRTPLVEEGVVRNYFYDLQTAGLAGQKSTGNGQRGLGTLPSPAPHAFVFAEGNLSYEDMLGDVKEGLLVDQMMGAWAGNVLAGEFSGNVHLGYKIENGQITGRVKDTILSGNVYAALKNLAGVGSESVWVGGTAKMPYLYFRGLSVASRE
jgi:PmbA protein